MVTIRSPLLLTVHMQVLLFLAVKMYEEEEKATLENFMESSILELLFNETEDEKDISTGS